MTRARNVALLASAFALASCGMTGGSADESPASSKPEFKPADFKVALLTPGPVNDAGWSAMAYDGLKAIETEQGARVDNQEATGAKIKDSFRSYAQKGYKLVFGHGYEYNAPAVEVAKDFPDTAFVTSSGAGVAKNVGAIRFNLEQSFYLAGATAAMLSKTHTVGMVGGPDVPSIRSTFKAFRAGAVSVDPKIKVLETFTNKDADVAAAKQAAESEISQGADLLIHQANAAAQGVFDAAKEHNILAFGANLDQNDNPSGVIVASATINARPAFLELAKQVKDGTFNGSVVMMSMDKGAIDFVWNPKLEAKVPADVRTKIAMMKEGIVDGKISVPKDKF